MYDVIIIGAGPAGITAGLYTQRGNLKTLIIHNGKTSLENANKIENYYGFENGITGKELYFQGIRQAQNIGIDVKNEEVIKIEMIEKSFKVKTTKNEYISKTIIIAMGTKKKTLQIDGVKKFEGRGISYCAICDGFFYRNKDVAVIGNGDYAISEVNDLLPVVNKITILTNGKTAPDIRSEKVEINIGEKEDDPVVGVSDLLIHLASEQMTKKADKVVEGEDLNVLVGSMPAVKKTDDSDSENNQDVKEERKELRQIYFHF